MTSPIQLGEIYIIRLPFVSGSGAKHRPVLVTGLPNSKGDILGIPGSSRVNQWRESWQVVVMPEDMASGRLMDPTVFPASKQMVFSPRLFAARVGQVNSACLERILRQTILRPVKHYGDLAHTPPAFESGVTTIPPSGKVLGAAELELMVEAALDGWLTTGRFNTEFEQQLAAFLGVRSVSTVNSGSSANLLAFAALTSPRLGERAIRPGDEVITVAAGFPTTVNPILQYGVVPVFVDVELATYNIDASRIEEAISPRTRAIMLAHTLGNPFNLEVVTHLCRQHHLWLIEDCCDALGATYQLPSAAGSAGSESGIPGRVGTFGDIGTLSFYPAHHITMGEGGAVFTSNPELKTIVESFRDWGRDCYCAPGRDNTCGKRFQWRLGDLPAGYDHKYIYAHAGYNMKITDMQAACGLAQLQRLPEFITARKRNFAFLRERLQRCEEFLILPEATPNSDPSWFGFLITVRETADFNRLDLINYLNQNQIGTRLLFAGNLTRQPYMQGRNFRVSGELNNTNLIMNNTFWIGVYPGLSEEMLSFMVEKLEIFCGIGF